MDTNTYYSQQDKMILRDYLALDRTLLALERTYLSYARTAIGLFSAGIACVKLIIDSPLIYVIGMVFLAAAPVVFLYGMHRYIMLKAKFDRLSAEEKQNEGQKGERLFHGQ